MYVACAIVLLHCAGCCVVCFNFCSITASVLQWQLARTLNITVIQQMFIQWWLWWWYDENDSWFPLLHYYSWQFGCVGFAIWVTKALAIANHLLINMLGLLINFSFV